jgi:branched-chain amino acid transport system substrate-binding protein
MKQTRRTFIKHTAAAAGAMGFPLIGGAQATPIKIGVLHPVTGGLAFPGQQSREGAMLAIEEINARGGIKSMGGAKIQPVLGDAQSQPQVGVAEVEKMNEQGVTAIVGAYASAICLAHTQAAAKYNIPCIIDQGVAEQIVQRGLKNVFRFGPGYDKVVRAGINYLHIMNTVAGKPIKTAVLVHEESLFGTGTAQQIARDLPAMGYEVLETIKHANPTRDFNNIALRIKSRNPDVIIPSSYLNEYVLLLKTLKQQGVAPKAIYSIFGGGGSNPKVIKENAGDVDMVLDCNHWYNPKNPKSREVRARAEKKGLFFTHEVLMAYTVTMMLGDALERAKSAKREAVLDALQASNWSDHIMPYGATKFVNGQNDGAQPLVTQYLKGDVKVVLPNNFAEAEAIFPARKG